MLIVITGTRRCSMHMENCTLTPFNVTLCKVPVAITTLAAVKGFLVHVYLTITLAILSTQSRVYNSNWIAIASC